MRILLRSRASVTKQNSWKHSWGRCSKVLLQEDWPEFRLVILCCSLYLPSFLKTKSKIMFFSFPLIEIVIPLSFFSDWYWHSREIFHWYCWLSHVTQGEISFPLKKTPNQQQNSLLIYTFHSCSDLLENVLALFLCATMFAKYFFTIFYV